MADRARRLPDQENRTFDHLFGTFPGANGVSYGYDRGARRRLTAGTDGSIGSEDIPHCYVPLEAWNHGRMDGFNQGAVSDRWAYTQLHRVQLPTTGTGRASSCWRTTSSRPGRTLVSTICIRSPRSRRRSRQPTTDRRFSLEQHVRMRRTPRDRRSRSWTRRVTGKQVSRASTSRPRRSAHGRRHRLGVLRGRTRPARLHLVGVRRGPSHPGDEAVSPRAAGRRSSIGDIKADQLPPVTWITPRYEVSGTSPVQLLPRRGGRRG